MKPKAEDTEWVEEEEIDTSGLPISWRSDHWFNFYWIAETIQEREGISRGVAERTCAPLAMYVRSDVMPLSPGLKSLKLLGLANGLRIKLIL